MYNLFNANKAVHSLEVANFMKAWAPKLKLNPNEAWIIGYVHDIGYTLYPDQHSTIGATMMSCFSESLSHYISLHDSRKPCSDDMEFLLRLADLVIDETGKYVGIESRIKSVNLRNCFKLDNELQLQKELLCEYATAHNYSDIFNSCL